MPQTHRRLSAARGASGPARLGRPASRLIIPSLASHRPDGVIRVTAQHDLVEHGRTAYERRHWSNAYALLREADTVQPLGDQDLERLSVAAHLLGHEEECIALLERAHQEAVAAGEVQRALRASFWLTSNLMELGEYARGSGWAARAHRLLDDCPDDCAERGYVDVLDALQAAGSGDVATAQQRFASAAATAARNGDADLETLARHGVGRALLQSEEAGTGLAVLDDVMVDLTTRELSPIVVGIVYCSVLEACLNSYELGRAREWTASLTRWCAEQPDMVPFRGQCLAYRSEVMRLQGAWPDALAESQQACEILSRPPPHPALGPALYQLAETHRVRCEFAEAEERYREASRWGRPPEPGLPLLWLAQGRVPAAAAAIRRVLDEAADRTARGRLLPAGVEILLAVGDLDAAQVAVTELVEIAAAVDTPLLAAFAARAQGAVVLAEQRPLEALAPLRQSAAAWQQLDVPYEAARTRVLLSRAYRALGDTDMAEVELAAARWAFERLGARTDLAEIERLLGRAPAGPPGGLTAREVEVLRLVAAGKMNREVAADLVISEKTVARHVSNILAKLDLSSRAAATAYAYEQGLISRQ